MDERDELVTADVAAELLEVRRDRVDVMVESGMLQPVEVDQERLFHRSEVLAVRLQGG